MQLHADIAVSLKVKISHDDHDQLCSDVSTKQSHYCAYSHDHKFLFSSRKQSQRDMTEYPAEPLAFTLMNILLSPCFVQYSVI